MDKELKSIRICELIIRLLKGDYISKKTYMSKFKIEDRTMRRDIQEAKKIIVRLMPKDSRILSKDISDDKIYYMAEKQKKLKYKDLLVILKILTASRAFGTEEMLNLKNLILANLFDSAELAKYISNDIKDYTQLNHIIEQEKNGFFKISERDINRYSENPKEYSQQILDFERIISRKKKIFLSYETAEKKQINIKVIPLDVVFSEFYFYLILTKDDDLENYFFYRVDRILSCKVISSEYVSDDVYNFYERSDIKKYILFMQKGELINVKFKFWGKSVNAVMDRMPTAKIIGETDGQKIIQATGFSRGLKMWLLTQGEFVEVLEPEDFRQEMKETIKNMLKNYT